VVALLASYDGQKLSLICACAADSGLDARQLLQKHLAPLTCAAVEMLPWPREGEWWMKPLWQDSSVRRHNGFLVGILLEVPRVAESKKSVIFV
jgi:hypothetical protein